MLKSSKPVIVEFWYRECAWCQKLKPIYESLEGDYPSVVFARINILESEANQKIGEGYGVMGTPTTKLFCEGREVGEVVGFMPRDSFKGQLDSILKNSSECLKSSTQLKG